MILGGPPLAQRPQLKVAFVGGGGGGGGLGVAALQVQSALFKTCPGGQIGVWVEAAEIRVFRMRAQVKLESWRNPRGGGVKRVFCLFIGLLWHKIGGVEGMAKIY